MYFRNHHRQDAALKELANETKIPEEEVMRIYEAEIARLEAGAKVRTYIPAIALHRARARLHRRSDWRAARREPHEAPRLRAGNAIG